MFCDRCGNKEHDAGARVCRVCGHPVKDRARATARVSSNWQDVSSWRRHIIQRLGAPPVEIKEGETFVFGRSSESSMKINSPKVSRRHAEVVWIDGQPRIRDLGSENGTEVNGKPITEQPLVDGDEIAIGPFGCTYRCLQGRTSIQVAQELSDSKADTQSMMAVAMSGNLSDMGVYELLETLSYNQKTGTLDVYTPKGAEGTVMLQEGLPLYSAASHLVGEQAVYHMLTWTEGQYRFVKGINPDLQPNVWTTLQDILAQARRRDVQKRQDSATGKLKRGAAKASKPSKPQATQKHVRKAPPKKTGRRPPPKQG